MSPEPELVGETKPQAPDVTTKQQQTWKQQQQQQQQQQLDPARQIPTSAQALICPGASSTDM
ncbi:uncharacterized protein UV8b_02410 [Ustilaginoidea virens]|uniref:Uncharacterized protein n=1 Tax=Ustilaginoidea virens TaxID=1159556 RepID=A0A8E5HMF7_USTVR|nr:uncharacterized protein UV8b_02410 [Ustilaginoidea virens]QUC18169.1 hypothetical protein UV8b_02410 [Ustilaginoidea virens]